MTDERVRVLVVDDELIARRRMLRLLGAMPHVVIAGECDSGEEMLERARSGVDVVLLDVQMPGLTGLEALQLLPADGPYVIFCTAHDQHALPAFDAGAIDYVLKPVDAQRLVRALSRASSRSQRQRFSAEVERQHHAPFQRLAFASARGIVLVNPDDIIALVLDGELVSVRTGQGTFLSELPLNELHERLPGDRFERVHRRAVINLACVERLDPLPTGGLIARMRDGSLVEVSRQAARALRRRLGLR
jgi:two-component system LytT family response regulator